MEASTPGGFVDIVAEIETLALVAPAGGEKKNRLHKSLLGHKGKAELFLIKLFRKKKKKRTDLMTSAFAASTPGGFIDIVAEIETIELVAPAGMTTKKNKEI